jgi:Na+/phosphate symporter
MIMETQNNLIKSIFSTTKKIQEEYPELTKYLVEMPEHFLDNPENGVNTQELKNYLESLEDIVNKYAKEQDAIN